MITPKITNLGYSNLWTDMSTILGYASNFQKLITKLFSNGEQGFAYNPNDLTTLYQDAAGTIPVTAQGQPVGLVLDKSKGLSLSSNINSVTNIESVPIGGAAFNSYPIGGNSVAGKAYLFEFAVTDYSGTGNVTVSGGGSQWLVNPSALPSAPASNVTYKVILFALVSAPLLFFTRSTNQCKFSNISVKELAGNHAYQTVSASRPILQQTPILGNELVVNGDFSAGLTGWGTVSANALVQDGGCVVTATGAGSRMGQTLNTVVGKTYKVSFTSLSNAFTLDARAGTYPAAMGTTLSSVSTLRTGGYSLLFTATTTTTSIYTNSYVGAGYSYSIDNISVREVLGYYTDQNYLEFDGVDDLLVTNNIDFTMTDKVSLFAGVRKLSDAAAGMLIELSSNASTTSGTFGINAPDAPNSADYLIRLRGGFDNFKKITENPAPITTVISARLDAQQLTVNNKINVRLNGITSAASGSGTPSTTQNFINQPLYIGRRGGTSLPFNGRLYSLIGISRLTTDSETIALEKAIAKNTGVTLNV